MRVIRSSEYRRMPWKNGGGETIEIAVSPSGATLDNFDWRVSMARVDAPGPFSVFPETDRSLAVLQGGGLRLRFSPDRIVSLSRDTAPFSFAADVPVEAELIEGAIVDLNVMTRRGKFEHRLTRAHLKEPIGLTADTDVTLVLVQESSIDVQGSGPETCLSPGDALIVDGHEPRVELIPHAPTTLMIARMWRSQEGD